MHAGCVFPAANTYASLAAVTKRQTDIRPMLHAFCYGHTVGVYSDVRRLSLQNPTHDFTDPNPAHHLTNQSQRNPTQPIIILVH